MSLVAVGAAGVDRYHRGGPFEYRGHQKRDDRRGKNPRGDKDDTILSVIASRQQESPIKKPMVQHFPRKRPLSSAASEVHDSNELAFGSFSSENVENPVKSPDDGDFFSRSEGAGGGKERERRGFVCNFWRRFGSGSCLARDAVCLVPTACAASWRTFTTVRGRIHSRRTRESRRR